MWSSISNLMLLAILRIYSQPTFAFHFVLPSSGSMLVALTSSRSDVSVAICA